MLSAGHDHVYAIAWQIKPQHNLDVRDAVADDEEPGAVEANDETMDDAQM